MFSSLMCAVGLAACCGLSILHDQPQIKAAISESVGNNQVTTPVAYGDLSIADDNETTFFAVNFDSSVFGTTSYIDYSNLVFEGPLVCYNYDQDMIYQDYFPNSNVAGALATKYGLICITHYRHTTTRNFLYVTFAINTSFAKSLSEDGVNTYFDIYTEDFNIDITNCSYQINYYDSSFMEENNSFRESLAGVYFNELSGYDSVGADYNNSPFAFDWQYEYWDNENEEYVIGSRLGFSASFPNTNTNGFESYNHPFLWNHFVSVLSWPSTNDISDTSPFGDNIFTSFAMKGLEVNSNGAYYSGYNAGYDAGYGEGAAASQQEAYNNGFRAGQASAQNVTWTGLFGSIADTPIIMLRGMFNFDLFGMNVLSVVLTLLTAIVVLRIVLKILL